MRSEIQENPFKAGAMVRCYKRVGITPTAYGHVALDTPYVGQLDYDVVEGNGICIGVAQLGTAGPSLHFLRSTAIKSMTINEDGTKAVACTRNSTYELELLTEPYTIQPGDIHP